MSAVAAITCSNRSSAGERADESGELLARLLGEAGHDVVYRTIVADELEAIRAAVAAGIEHGARLVVTTGGTGLTPTDVTPEAIRPLLDREVPGIAEALRQANRDRVPSAVLSRGVAGVVGSSLVVTLPGSPGGVRDGVALLVGLIPHALDQIAGGDHRLAGGPTESEPSADLSRPVSGLRFTSVSDRPLDVEAHERSVALRSAGAHVLFLGVVRDHDHGRSVVELEYEGHPGAGDVLAAVAADVAARPGVEAVAVSHRVGRLAVGEVALVAAVSAAHRGEAFEACAELVDEVKRRVPIWKRQVFADGSDEWVSCAH